jgi:hypothetical protein
VAGQSSADPFSRTAVGVAVGLIALLAIGVVVTGKLLGSADGGATTAPGTESAAAPETAETVSAQRTGPLALVPVEAPHAGSAGCVALLGGLPAELTSGEKVLATLPLAEPAPPATRAWGAPASDPVVLRCGLTRPPELTATSRLREISGVRWLPVTGSGAATWYVVDRDVYLALTVPNDAGTGPLQEVSEAVRAILPARAD